jgi:Bacteriophage HK97-gp10, putative tail-component
MQNAFSNLKALDRAAKDIDRFGKDVLNAALKATETELTKLLADAKENAPVDTGRLRESGRLIRSGTNFSVVFGDVTVRGIEVDYAQIVDLRTNYLQDAADKHLSGLADKVTKEVNRKLF